MTTARIFVSCFVLSWMGLSAICFGAEASASVTIVESGKPRAEIVVAEDALSSVQVAARDLQTYVEEISGATLPVVNQPSGGGVLPIYVGDSAPLQGLELPIADLPPEGFLVLVRNDYIALVGRDEQRPNFPYSHDNVEAWQEFSGQLSVPPRGVPMVGTDVGKLGFRSLDATATLYAVSTFLEELGVRWYAPYEDGTVIPNMATIEIPLQDTEMEPRFMYRDIYGVHSTDAEGGLWLKRLKTGASHAYNNDAHSTNNIVNSDAMLEAHPEYYARGVGGKPIIGHNGYIPKLSNPGFRDASMVFLDKMFEAYPPLKAATLGMPDAFGKIDEEDARKWADPEAPSDGAFSSYVWDYWLDMAARLQKSHPDKILNCYSYTSYQRPPDQVEKLPENVAVTMIYGVALSMLPVYTEYLTPMRDKWLSMLTSDKFFIWEYVLFYRKNNPTVPVVFTKRLQEEMQNMEGKLVGKFTECTRVRTEDGHSFRLSHPALTHMLLYLQAKLYWNPDLDLQALLNEFYELFYGPAKNEMKEFWEFAEEVWTRPESRSITPTTGYLKEEDVTRYFDLLTKARSRVETGDVYDRRIAALEAEMAPVQNYFDRLTRTGPKLQGKIEKMPEKLDGDLDKPFWSSGPWYDMRELVSGHPLAERLRTSVAFRLSADRKHLLVGVKCGEPEVENLVAKAAKRDDLAIFEDDAIEIYLESPERSYFKIVVNSDGVYWDESQDGAVVERDTMPVLWNPKIEVATKKGPKGWSAEIAIPTDDLGDTTLGPSSSHPWGVNVCRARWVSGEIEAFGLSPTGALFFGDLTKLGFLSFQ